jgi:hypothetical protein
MNFFPVYFLVQFSFETYGVASTTVSVPGSKPRSKLNTAEVDMFFCVPNKPSVLKYPWTKQMKFQISLLLCSVTLFWQYCPPAAHSKFFRTVYC